MRPRHLGLLGASIAMASGLWLACGSNNFEDFSTSPDGGGVPDAVSTETGASDAATPVDAAAGPQDAGGGDGGINPADAGPGGTTTVILCGSTTCAIPTENCCVEQLGGGGTAFGCASTCLGLDGGNDTAALKCSGQSNCAAGTVCCVRQAGNNNSAASECKLSCGGNEAQLCALAAVPSECTGTTCSNNNIGDWALPPTYATCGGKGN